MVKAQKWEISDKAFLCKCGLCFLDRDNFSEHLRDTRRWREYHYAPSIGDRGPGFIVYLVKIDLGRKFLWKVKGRRS